MPFSLSAAIELLGTVAFALTGASVGIQRGMDLFGVNMLAVTTACGGGILRDLVVDVVPPAVFRNPRFVAVALVTANVVFLFTALHRHMPGRVVSLYERLLFWFDTLGLAAFTVDGVTVGLRTGHGGNAFLLVFLGFITGVGGGVLRDVLAGRIPDIFRRHVYALAVIAGALVMTLSLRPLGERPALLLGFSAVVAVRVLAARYRWNLPRILPPEPPRKPGP